MLTAKIGSGNYYLAGSKSRNPDHNLEMSVASEQTLELVCEEVSHGLTGLSSRPRSLAYLGRDRSFHLFWRSGEEAT